MTCILVSLSKFFTMTMLTKKRTYTNTKYFCECSVTKWSCVGNSNGESKKIHKTLESVKMGSNVVHVYVYAKLDCERRSLSFGVCFGSHTLCALLRGNCRNGHRFFSGYFFYYDFARKRLYVNLWTLIIFMYDWTIYTDFGRFCCAWLPPDFAV